MKRVIITIDTGQQHLDDQYADDMARLLNDTTKDSLVARVEHYVDTFPAFTGVMCKTQVMATVYADTVHVATREWSSATWGPPTVLRRTSTLGEPGDDDT
jgi:hypothetical protein